MHAIGCSQVVGKWNYMSAACFYYSSLPTLHSSSFIITFIMHHVPLSRRYSNNLPMMYMLIYTEFVGVHTSILMGNCSLIM